MEIDIFEVINKELTKQKRKAPWLAGEVGTSPRNMHAILNDRKDIYLGIFLRISIALRRNLFKLYVPLVDAAIKNANPQIETSDERKAETKSTINIPIKFPESRTDDLGLFIKQVQYLASEYGFETE